MALELTSFSSHTENQQNCDRNQWSSWLSSNDWNWWSSWPTRADDERWSSWSPWSHSSENEPRKYFDKSPPPEWDGCQPVKTWQDYRRMLKQWLGTTDVPIEKHGMLLWRALTGDAKLLISHFRDEELLRWDAGLRIFDVLVQAHKHISEFGDQDDFGKALYKLHRDRNQTLLQLANVARAAYLKHASYGYPLPDRTKGMIFLRQAKISGHLEDHIMAKTNGSKNFSDLLEAIQVLAQRPMSQTSSSYPSFNDDRTDSSFVTEYYDMDDYHDNEGDGYEDQYNEFEDYDSEWIDMSDIPEDMTFEEPELACILENLQKGRKGSGKYHRKGSKGLSKGDFPDKKGFGKR